MSFSKAALAAFVLSTVVGFAPHAVSAGVVLVKTPHKCRDNKTGRFIKGTYFKCPNGTHKA